MSPEHKNILRTKNDKWFEIHNLTNVLICSIVLYFLIIEWPVVNYSLRNPQYPTSNKQTTVASVSVELPKLKLAAKTHQKDKTV